MDYRVANLEEIAHLGVSVNLDTHTVLVGPRGFSCILPCPYTAIGVSTLLNEMNWLRNDINLKEILLDRSIGLMRQQQSQLVRLSEIADRANENTKKVLDSATEFLSNPS